jgi:hypothetical protein
MSDLTNLRDLVELHLQDTGNLVFSTDQIDAAIRIALMDYSLAVPQVKQEIITLAADGAEVPLSSLPSFQFIISAWWPYDSTLDFPSQSPNSVLGWDIVHLSGSGGSSSASISLITAGGVYPLTGDQLRLNYACLHTITGGSSSPGSALDTVTSLPLAHFSLLAKGAAGYALLANASNRDDVLNPPLLIKLSSEWLKNFRDNLVLLSSYLDSDSSAFLQWPGMDKYDRVI